VVIPKSLEHEASALGDGRSSVQRLPAGRMPRLAAAIKREALRLYADGLTAETVSRLLARRISRPSVQRLAPGRRPRLSDSLRGQVLRMRAKDVPCRTIAVALGAISKSSVQRIAPGQQPKRFRCQACGAVSPTWPLCPACEHQAGGLR
jgi:hypothetical protein